jgi:hypothetical protein
LPYGQKLRDWLDSRDVSWFRPTQSDETIRAVADRDRRAISENLMKARLEHGMIAVDLRDFKAIPSDIWGTSQGITGLLKTPHLEMATRRELIGVLDYAFSSGMFIEGYGWLAHADGNSTEVEPALWTIAAISCALGTPGIAGRRSTRDF